jgi:uncharacterized protein (DUF983 family)
MSDRQHLVARAVRLLGRGLCLRCPRCGARSLFRTWFTMYERCAVCQLRFEREQGYFLGAMYINYGVTVVLALIGSFALEWWIAVSLTQQLLLWVGFCALFPVLFFRYSRSLWLAFDHIFDPVEDQGLGDADEKGW